MRTLSSVSSLSWKAKNQSHALIQGNHSITLMPQLVRKDTVQKYKLNGQMVDTDRLTFTYLIHHQCAVLLEYPPWSFLLGKR